MKSAQVPSCPSPSRARRFSRGARQQNSDCEIEEYPNVGRLFSRKLDSQEDDFDPDPTDVADARTKGDFFLAEHGFLPKFPLSQRIE